MTTQTTGTTTPKTRNLNRKVEGVERMKRGVRLDLGYDSPAYLATSVHADEPSVGDRIVGAYEMRTGRDGGRYANIVRVEDIRKTEESQESTKSAAQKETSQAVERGTTTAMVEVKNVQKVASGYLIWSKNGRHTRPTFAPYHRLEGIDIYKVRRARLTFYENHRRQLVISNIDVIETK